MEGLEAGTVSDFREALDRYESEETLGDEEELAESFIRPLDDVSIADADAEETGWGAIDAMSVDALAREQTIEIPIPSSFQKTPEVEAMEAPAPMLDASTSPWPDADESTEGIAVASASMAAVVASDDFFSRELFHIRRESLGDGGLGRVADEGCSDPWFMDDADVAGAIPIDRGPLIEIAAVSVFLFILGWMIIRELPPDFSNSIQAFVETRVPYHLD